MQTQTFISPNIKVTLVAMCETRWVLRHNCIQRFKEMFIPIVNALENLNKGEKTVNKETSSTAHQLLRVILNGEFFISLTVLEKIFSFTLPLCNQLQRIKYSDLSAAINHIENVRNVLNEIRTNSNDEFKIMFEESCTILGELGCDINIPRNIKKQNNRSNVPATLEYYERSIFIPFLDHIMTHLTERFINHKEILSSLDTLIPNRISNSTKGPSEKCLEFYNSILPKCDELKEEYLLWKVKWFKKDKNERPSNALQILSECDDSFYPSIKKMLEILVTLPMSTATAERTFLS